MFLLTTDFVALNVLFPHDGNAVSACSNATCAHVSISHFGEANREMHGGPVCVYYTFCHNTGLLYCFSLKFDTVYCVCVFVL